MPVDAPRPNADLPGEVRLLGDSALVFVFGTVIDDAVNARVLAAWRALRGRLPAGVTDLVPAYTTLTVFYDPGAWEPEPLATLLRRHVREHGGPVVEGGREFAVPVCYASDCAPDMAAVCEHTGLSAAEVIARHSAVAYRVNFLGFTPGFPYLSGLDPRLATPRRATPRLAVPAGSVAIGGTQTGIYPQGAPGGWQVIGRTPLALFDAQRVPPCLLAPGDTVRFVPVDERAFARIADTPA